MSNKTCKWEQDADGIYGTECGKIWCFTDDDIEANGAKFCIYCGKPIEEVEFQEES